jgi:hypothetical protein
MEHSITSASAMMQIVEGGCVDPSGGARLKAKLTRQGVELLAARVRRLVYIAGSPWRALRRALSKARLRG